MNIYLAFLLGIILGGCLIKNYLTNKMFERFRKLPPDLRLQIERALKDEDFR